MHGPSLERPVGPNNRVFWYGDGLFGTGKQGTGSVWTRVACTRRTAVSMGRMDEHHNIAPHVACEAKHDWRRSGRRDFGEVRRVRVLGGVSIGAVLILAGCSSNSATSSSTTAATAGSSGGKAPITIALVTSLTGPGADQFVPGPDAFNARIAAQNAIGGVNGHMIKGIVVDDQTTEPTVAIQDALSKGAFGIVAESPLFFLGAKIPQQQGVPVTGGSVDGPEWGEQPYTNMFAADTGSVDPTQPASTLPGKFMKEHGGTILGAYALSGRRHVEGRCGQCVEVIRACGRHHRRTEHDRSPCLSRFHWRCDRGQAEARQCRVSRHG